MDREELTNRIKQECKQLGFDGCGIARIETLSEEMERYKQWLEAGYNGEMAYLERYTELRADPSKLVPGAKSMIVVLLNYYPKERLRLKRYKISSYAWGIDYHRVIKRKLWDLYSFIKKFEPLTEGRAFVDSAPVLEREWARRAGLGWIGKNGLLLTKRGSYNFIGELIINLELVYDKPFEKNYCGSCRRCIDSCPTGALLGNGLMDARKCLSYLTIEKRGEFEPETNLHNWAFGCDVCQQVCPWNNRARPTHVEEFNPSDEMKQLTDERLESLSKAEFKHLFKQTPIMRAGYKGLMRNIKQIKRFEQ